MDLSIFRKLKLFYINYKTFILEDDSYVILKIVLHYLHLSHGQNLVVLVALVQVQAILGKLPTNNLNSNKCL